MGNKIINLFGDSEYTDNTGKKYSELLQQFITAFSYDFSETDDFEEIIDFAIIAWNFGNMRVIVPEQEYEEIMLVAARDDLDVALINKMTAYKAENFSEFSNSILDYEIEKSDKEFVLALTTQEEDIYFASMSEGMEFDFSQEEFEENYINRTAILVKPLQPFLNWCSNLYSEEIDEMSEINTYLISEDIYDVDA